VADGTLVDMSEMGCHIAGCMPVEVGMRLRLCIWASDGSIEIVVAHGSVRWAKGLEFGVQLDEPLCHASESIRSLDDLESVSIRSGE
jgi:hypothetical protein